MARNHPEILLNEYRLCDIIFSDGGIDIYFALSLKSGQKFIVKFIPHTHPEKEFYVQGVSHLREMNHCSIITLSDAQELPDYYAIVLPYLTGGNLLLNIHEHGPFIIADNPQSTVKVMWNLVSALNYIHQLGYVHNNIRPESIFLLSEYQSDPFAILTGFKYSDKITNSCIIPHKPDLYSAPETIENRKGSLQADVYALGMVFYVMICGMSPHSYQKYLKSIGAMNPNAIFSGPLWDQSRVDISIKGLIYGMIDPRLEMRLTIEECTAQQCFQMYLVSNGKNPTAIELQKSCFRSVQWDKILDQFDPYRSIEHGMF